MSEFEFVQLADPQLGIIESWANDPPERRASMTEGFRRLGLIPSDGELPAPRPDLDGFSEETRRFELAIDIVNTAQAKFVAVCGDVIHNFGNTAEREAALRVAERLDPDIPIRWVPGNHDVCPDHRTPTPEGLREYRQHFGEDYYSFEIDETLFLVLNSEIFNQPQRIPGEVGRHLEFVRDELGSQRGRDAQHLIAFMHTPLFIRDPETDQGGVVSAENRQLLLSVLTEHGVEAAFAGHLHLNRYAYHQGLQMVVSGAVGMPFWGEAGYRLVDVSDNGISHQYFPLEAVSSA